MNYRNRISYIWLSILLALVIVVSACSTSSPSASSTESRETEKKQINLKFASSLPELHPIAQADKAFFKKIEEETNGQVKITPYYGGVLISGNEEYTELTKGVADLGYYSGSYINKGMEIEKSMRALFIGLPDGLKGAEMGREIYKELMKKFPQIAEEHSGLKTLAIAGRPPYHLLTKKKAVTKIDDLKGMKIKASGEYAKILAKLGVEPINMPMSETYTAVEKGIIDGVLAPYETLKSFYLAEVVDYVTPLGFAIAPTPNTGMNLETYNSLPPDIQKVFDDNAEFWGKKIEEELYKADDVGIQFAKEKNVQFVDMNKEDLDILYDVAVEVLQEEMKKVDAVGKPGTEIFNEARRLIQNYTR